VRRIRHPAAIASRQRSTFAQEFYHRSDRKTWLAQADPSFHSDQSLNSDFPRTICCRQSIRLIHWIVHYQYRRLFLFKVLDTETLLNVAPDLADRRDILKDFISETRPDVAELERALEADDFPASVRLAHSIKGACSMVGAQELAQTCATIERLGRQRVPQAASRVRAVFDRLAAHLDAAFEERGHRWS
jgi:HPt (histidine-containing phosphotransfer) domain-containing protein